MVSPDGDWAGSVVAVVRDGQGPSWLSWGSSCHVPGMRQSLHWRLCGLASISAIIWISAAGVGVGAAL